MLFILLSWLYILTISLIIGITINQIIGLQKNHSIITLFFGFFGVTLIASIWAIPFAIDTMFHGLLLLMVLILGFIYRIKVKQYLSQLKLDLSKLNKLIKVLLVLISLLIIAQCASPPFLVDNESYYIQTIKWLNTYGFVNGLVNLHLFMGQTSGWHILQSAFNFSFIYENFNDISGLALLLGNVYALFLLYIYLSKKDSSKLNLVFGLFPLWNVFLFQFISTPSPDLAIYVLAHIVLHQFILCYKNYNKASFYAVLILTLFMAFIKPTGLIFCIFPIILYKRYYIYTRSITSTIIFFSSLTLLLFAIKNFIISGNLLFPLQGIESLKASWSLPNSVENYFAEYMQPYGYHLSPEAYQDATIITRLKVWLFAPIPDGLFNILMVLLLGITPFVIKRLNAKSPFWIIYGIAIINLALLLLTSPQYRFFFPFIMCFSLMLMVLLYRHKLVIKLLTVSSILLAAIPLLFPLNSLRFTNNSFHEVSSNFTLEYFIEPYKNSKYPKEHKVIQLNETQIYTPTQIDFFWGTGDIPLPALNKEQLDYFKLHFKVIPQQRTQDLKDGFISKLLP